MTRPNVLMSAGFVGA